MKGAEDRICVVPLLPGDTAQESTAPPGDTAQDRREAVVSHFVPWGGPPEHLWRHSGAI